MATNLSVSLRFGLMEGCRRSGEAQGRGAAISRAVACNRRSFQIVSRAVAGL